MPTYEYECQNCGFHLEVFQSMKESPLRKCVNCGEDSLKRLIGTGAGIIFKGSGFYCTDYRSDSYKNAAKNDKKDSSSSPSSSSKNSGKNSSGDASSGKSSSGSKKSDSKSSAASAD